MHPLIERFLYFVFITLSYTQTNLCFLNSYKRTITSNNQIPIVSSKLYFKNPSNHSPRRKEFSLNIVSEEDLPNILGINPLEAAALFGVLYYIYGPKELYSYAREAGKFAATYLPVIKDLAVNIYNEFKEYIDEDRERDELKKRGMDITNFPRRTTNLIERVQESLNMFSEMAKVDNNSIGGEMAAVGLTPELFKGVEKDDIVIKKNNNLQSVVTDMDTTSNTDSNTSLKKVRKTKKKILESKNIDVQKLIEYETKVASSSQLSEVQVEAELNKSFNLVQERISSMTSPSLPSPSSSFMSSSSSSPSSSSNNPMNNNFNDDDFTERSTDIDDDYYFPDSTSASTSSISSSSVDTDTDTDVKNQPINPFASSMSSSSLPSTTTTTSTNNANTPPGKFLQ